MKLSSTEREAARVLHHVMGMGTYQCSRIFGVWPSSMTRILRNVSLPKYKNFSKGRYNKDREEILAYIAQNGPCSTFDIELCLHHENGPVLRHLKGLLEEGKITKAGKFYQITIITNYISEEILA